MKKFYVFFAALAISGQVVAKPVDVATAKKAGFNFLSKKINSDVVKAPADMQLVYQDGNAYYVFNAGNAGFVLIAADDQVTPVLGYSAEQGFDPNDLAPATKDWFKNYADEIKFVVDNNIPATDVIAEEWHTLLSGKSVALKTTVVTPLLTTRWNQNPYYNALCPSDGTGQAVTGCVATAMAQIMKYWNYPATGAGSHTYTHPDFGPLSANFGTGNYNWTIMPNSLQDKTNPAAKTAVATLMYHCGVAVEMDYGVNSSGAFSQDVVDALKNYFKYDKGLRMVYRNSQPSTAAWTQLIKNELDLGRPLYYSGSGSGGGHAWVCEGYDANGQFYMNWGWGGSSNGYFLTSNLNPGSQGAGGGTTFNSGQAVITGITPPSSMTPDSYEPNNIADETYNLTFSGPGVTTSVSANANIHIGNDMDYYHIILPIDGAKYKVTARVHDLAKSDNGNTYTADVQFGHSTNQSIWSAYIDDVMTTPLEVEGGKEVYFRVASKTLGATGTYFFEASATNMALGIDGVTPAEMIVIYPNPATDKLNISMGGITVSSITLADMQGRVVRTAAMENAKAASVDVNGLANGIYILNMQSDKGAITKKITVSK